MIHFNGQNCAYHLIDQSFSFFGNFGPPPRQRETFNQNTFDTLIELCITQRKNFMLQESKKDTQTFLNSIVKQKLIFVSQSWFIFQLAKYNDFNQLNVK